MTKKEEKKLDADIDQANIKSLEGELTLVKGLVMELVEVTRTQNGIIESFVIPQIREVINGVKKT